MNDFTQTEDKITAIIYDKFKYGIWLQYTVAYPEFIADISFEKYNQLLQMMYSSDKTRYQFYNFLLLAK